MPCMVCNLHQSVTYASATGSRPRDTTKQTTNAPHTNKQRNRELLYVWVSCHHAATAASERQLAHFAFRP
eukprot:12919160-Prorocentrum_lima.AAC.1